MIQSVRQELDHGDSHIRVLPQEGLELAIFDHKQVGIALSTYRSRLSALSHHA